ncbi:hypothetical protein Tco_0459416 [Tanacetum coccineum]
MANLTDKLAKFGNCQNRFFYQGQVTLPGNTVTNPREEHKGNHYPEAVLHNKDPPNSYFFSSEAYPSDKRPTILPLMYLPDGLNTRNCLPILRSGYHQKDRKPSQNDKTEHGMEKTVQNQGQSPKMPKSESILKNTVGCNLNPSDGPGKPNSIIMKTLKAQS